MRVKRFFKAAMFCCCLSVSKLLRMRSADGDSPSAAAGRFLRSLYSRCGFLSFLCFQQEVENFKKVHLISREQFDCLTPEPPVDPNQEVPPGPPRPQQSKQTQTKSADYVLLKALN